VVEGSAARALQRKLMVASVTYRKAVLRVVGFALFTAACLFGSAGTLHWWNGWAFWVSGVAVVATLTGTVFRTSPELVEERMTAAKKAKAWDRVFVPLIAAVLPLLSIILAGLDRRLGWTHSITASASLLALVLALAANALTYWAMAANPFFSSHVRIQSDRGHTVVRHGPYAYVRHPGYTGSILYGLAAPILLGSLVAFWVGVATLILLVVRTSLEDRVLQNELNGYREYAGAVRYRLVPAVW
jgi:protein-S-isoprenylcysteine O-methyltransferase Ste14